MSAQSLGQPGRKPPIPQTEAAESGGDALMVVSVEGSVVFWNSSATTKFGWTAAEAQDHNVGEVLASPLLVQSIQEHALTLFFDGDWSGEFSAIHRNGTILAPHLRFSLIYSGSTALIGISSRTKDRLRQPRQIPADRLLAEAGTRLSDSLDYMEQLKTLLRLAVPGLADWCAVHLLRDDGSLERVALTLDAPKAESAEIWFQRQGQYDEADGLPSVLRTGAARLVALADSNLLEDEMAIQSYMIVPLKAESKTIGAISFVTTKLGRRLDEQSLAMAENLAGYLSVYIHNAQLFRTSQELNVKLEQRVDERTLELQVSTARLRESKTMIETLFRISNDLNSTLDIETILDVLVRAAIGMVGGESGFAGLCSPQGTVSRKYIRNGNSVEFTHFWLFGEGIPGLVVKNKRAYLTNEAASDPLVRKELSIKSGIRSLICVPVKSSLGEVLGFFEVQNKKGTRGFTDADKARLTSLGPHVSIAIQNALAFQRRTAKMIEADESSGQLRALAAKLEAAREEERIRIARNLHDELGQSLTAMKFDLASLTRQLVEKDLNLSLQAKHVTDQMDSMIKIVRSICTELRPGMLEDLGLLASLDWSARDFQKKTGIGFTVVATPQAMVEENLSAAASLAAYRIFLEALTNVARHSGARNVKVDIATTSLEFVIQIKDDGRGISPLEIEGRNTLGLLGMQERAQQFGGSVSLFGSESGTLVSVRLPIGKNDLENDPRGLSVTES